MYLQGDAAGSQSEVADESLDTAAETESIVQVETTNESVSVDEDSSRAPTCTSKATGNKRTVNTRLPNDIYGQQSKMIRCCVIHQLIWHCIYGMPEGTKPTVWERLVDFFDFVLPF